MNTRFCVYNSNISYIFLLFVYLICQFLKENIRINLSVNVCITSYNYINICFIFLVVFCCIQIQEYSAFWCMFLLSLNNSYFLSQIIFFCLKVPFVWQYCWTSFGWVSICLRYFFILYSLTFLYHQDLCVCILHTVDSWIWWLFS